MDIQRKWKRTDIARYLLLLSLRAVVPSLSWRAQLSTALALPSSRPGDKGHHHGHRNDGNYPGRVQSIGELTDGVATTVDCPRRPAAIPNRCLEPTGSHKDHILSWAREILEV